MNDIDYFEEENKIVRDNFELEDIINFQKHHDIQIIRGADFQYQCWIDKVCYNSSLTPLGALVIGIITWENKNFHK